MECNICNNDCNNNKQLGTKDNNQTKKDIGQETNTPININIPELIDQYGIALIIIDNKDNSPFSKIAELVSEDSNNITVKNPANISIKAQFDQIIGPDGVINPLITVSETYAISRYNIDFLDTSDKELQVSLKDIDSIISITDRTIIQQYLTNRGN